MESSLGCSESCRDFRNPIKLSNGCSSERYLMRQKYLRSYPLMMITKKKEKEENVAMRTKKWLKEKKRKYCRIDQGNKQTGGYSGGDKKSKPKFLGSSCVKACLKMLLVCVAKVDVVRLENQEPSGFGSKKL